MARAPTVRIGGFELLISWSSVSIVYSRLNYSISWFFSGGSSWSTLELVLRTPRHVRMPRGYRATRKSVSSFRRFLGVARSTSSLPVVSSALHRSSSRKTYLSWGVSFESISQTSSVSSCCARQASGWKRTGKRSSLFQRVSTRQICLM